MQMTNVTKGTKPSSTLYAICPAIYDSAGTNQSNKLGQFYASITKDNLVGLTMNVFKAESGSSTSSSLSIYYPASGNPYTSCPASDVANSILTTVNKSKAKNGYFQLGNGMIVNWGTSGTLAESGSLTITLSKAFTSTNYSVTANYKVQHTASDAEGVITVDNFTTTTFRLSAGYLNPNSGTVSWIAVGY